MSDPDITTIHYQSLLHTILHHLDELVNPKEYEKSYAIIYNRLIVRVGETSSEGKIILM